MEELTRLVQERDKADAELVRILKVDDQIIDAITDYWKCQQSGAD